MWGQGPGLCQTRSITQWTGPQGTGLSMTYSHGSRYVQPPWPAGLFTTVQVGDPSGYPGVYTSCRVCAQNVMGSYGRHYSG